MSFNINRINSSIAYIVSVVLLATVIGSIIALMKYYGIDYYGWGTFVLFLSGYVVVVLGMYWGLSFFSKIQTDSLMLRIVFGNVKKIPIVLSILVLFLLMPLSLYYTLYLTKNYVWFWISELFLALSYLLLLYTFFFLRYSNNNKVKIILRIAALVSMLFSIVVCCFIIYMCPILSLVGITETPDVQASISVLYTLSCKGIDVMFGVIIIILGSQIFDENSKKSLKKGKYLLFLRSFEYDKRWESSRLANLLRFSIPNLLSIKRIGDPQTFFSMRLGIDTFYLSNLNWKKEVAELISDAVIVFCVVDVTEGLFWEMFYHTNQINKYIYYLEDRRKCIELTHVLEKNEALKDNILTDAFKMMLNVPAEYDNDLLLFFLDDNFYITQSFQFLLSYKSYDSYKDELLAQSYKL